MMKIDNSNVTFELQTRTDLATSKNGTDIKRINATIFSGFAAKEDGNVSVQVELDSNLECKSSFKCDCIGLIKASSHKRRNATYYTVFTLTH